MLCMRTAGQSLQESCLFSAQGCRHHAYAAAPRLSIKCMFNGTATYRVGRACFAVDETGYLILNDGQAYEIQIDSPTRLQSFVTYFPQGWSQDVLRNFVTREDKLLDDPESPSGPVHFFEKFSPHDEILSPAISRLRREHQSGVLSDVLVEERLRGLLARMLQAQRDSFRGMAQVRAVRASTRAELWRRLHRARDFIRARANTPVSVSEMAGAACLSPFHFMRAFKATFRMTPHAYLSQCRVECAKFLLERTELPVTQICLETGFESLGTFSTWFSRFTGESPRAWRTKRAGLKK
jgi:AraC-like DNA-binding protein